MVKRNCLVMTTLVLLVACTQNDDVSTGPVFAEAGRPVQRVCGKDVCIRQAFKNIGNGAGIGECRVVKFDFPKSNKETEGPLAVLPSAQPGGLTTARARWPAAQVEARNVFWFRCEPAPRYES
jgi:hypothetical protein